MQNKFNFRQKSAIVILDLLVLVELAACLHWVGRYGEEPSLTFFLTYLPVILLTLVIGKRCIHKLRTKS